MNRQQIEDRTEQLLTPIAAHCGVSVYDVEYVKEGSDFFLRAYIDKEGGVTIDDCVEVTHALSDALDEEDFIEPAYTLEVSSPGLTRALTKDRHLQASIGEAVDIKLFQKRDGEKEFTGTLTAFDKDTISILMAGQADHKQDKDEDAVSAVSFARRDIAQIKRAFTD